MSAPVVAQTDNVSVNEGAQESFQYGEAEPRVFKKRFTRVFEHYVENNMTATGYTESYNGTGQVKDWQLDEGWHLIPYWNPAVAMTPGDLAQIGATGEGIRIDKLGFRVVQAQMFRTDITALTGVTELSNTFLDNPWWETYVDSHRNFEGMVVATSVAQTTAMHPGYAPLYSNNTMRDQEVGSFAAGLLPRVKWQWAATGTAPFSKAPQDLYDRREGANDGTFGVMSTLNGTGRQAMGTQSVQQFGHEWVNKDGGAWYPFNYPNDNSIWSGNFGRGAQYPATFPLQRQSILSGAAAVQSTAGGQARGTNLPNAKHNRWAKVDLDTLTPLGLQDTPKDCFIKIQRMHDIASPMRLAGRILIEYSCEVSIMPSEKLYMGLTFNTNGNNATTIDNKSAINEYTHGPLRSWRAWGIPNATPTSSGGSQGTIRFPPWQTFHNWFNSGGGDGYRPVAGFTDDWPGGDDPAGLFYKPPLELATLTFENLPGPPMQSQDTWFCLTESWDGDPPTAEGDVIDSFTRNGVHLPALEAFTTLSGVPPLVWAMEARHSDQFSGGDLSLTVDSNPLVAWLGPAAPADNLHHLFEDPIVVDKGEDEDEGAAILHAKKRKMDEE
uniref:Uncharacterized protein n=1 Tax=Parvoviridae sp. TaxID=1940570 RepID=A0A7D3V1I6_9VIRU|nr:MAG: hypothetical protein [Parvoviridae sp.]